MDASPIGIFDSGIGGITVWKHIKALLPKERLIYLADTAFCPYGLKSKEALVDRCRLITRFFLQQGCKMVVIACNTATAAAVFTLRAEFDIPFVAMEPAVKPAIWGTQNGVIGVLATRGTLQWYHQPLAKCRVKIIEQVGEGWVEAIERGDLDSEQTQQMVARLVQPMLDMGADYLVLGCTHYPYLLPVISKVAGPSVTILDPAPAVARQVRNVLTKNKDLYEGPPQGEDVFYYTYSSLVNVLPSAVANTAKGGTIKWRPYTFENNSAIGAN